MATVLRREIPGAALLLMPALFQGCSMQCFGLRPESPARIRSRNAALLHWAGSGDICWLLGPAQCVTQCVIHWEGLIKQPHVTQIRGTEAFAEFARQLFRQTGQQFLAIGSTMLAALFEFDDVPADFQQVCTSSMSTARRAPQRGKQGDRSCEFPSRYHDLTVH